MCIIVNKDVDLLVLLVGLGSTHKNVYLFKPRRYNKENNSYSANCMKSKIPAKYIFFTRFPSLDMTCLPFLTSAKLQLAGC